ncbi:hypothetical protein [Mycobacterium aquaticum]|uniref:Uncharacterized protein n=1 Tax=Mycobacterium aquaticum TaxID=1927124 RepID=A0A1X0B7R5_9MYCO|nr:hypothetical protein [Mycobacterium aquaticum]ORA38128.1 hypothetical protein BST13_05900 [Mycobacterium aquaticum]
MSTLVPFLDLSKPVGERLAPQMQQEIAEVAPSGLVNGAVTTAKLAEKAVTGPKLADGAATTEKIATNGVEAVNLAPGAVTTPKLDDDAVTAAKAGLGVVTAYDKDGNPVDAPMVFMTQTEYAAITPVPGVTYMLRAG